MRLRTPVLTILASAALGASLLTAGPAYAASCYGASCTGKNPSTSGCSAGTVRSVEAAGLYKLELRYSGYSSCNAFWTRGTFTFPPGSPYSWLSISLDRYNPYTGGIDYKSADVNANESKFTTMFGRSSGYSYRACMQERYWGGAVGSTWCTEWVKG